MTNWKDLAGIARSQTIGKRSCRVCQREASRRYVKNREEK